jgi:hypothetical protein
MVNIFPGFINQIAAKQSAGVLDKMREFADPVSPTIPTRPTGVDRVDSTT